MRLHSVLDVVTNSSSEAFVIPGSAGIEEVRLVVDAFYDELWRAHQDLLDSGKKGYWWFDGCDCPDGAYSVHSGSDDYDATGRPRYEDYYPWGATDIVLEARDDNALSPYASQLAAVLRLSLGIELY